MALTLWRRWLLVPLSCSAYLWNDKTATSRATLLWLGVLESGALHTLIHASFHSTAFFEHHVLCFSRTFGPAVH